MNQPLKPEEQARVLIDEQLTRAGWFVGDRRDIDLVNRRGNAVRGVIAQEIAEELENALSEINAIIAA